MINRRKFLGGLAGAAAVAGTGLTVVGGRALASTSPKATTLPLTITNNNGQYDNGSVYIYIVGNANNQQVWVDGDGNIKPVAMSDNGSDGYTDYSIPLAGSGDTKLTLPNLSGRIYVSLGDKLKFKAVTGADGSIGLQYPAGWVSSDPNYSILHDFAEFTFNDGGMYCNTTMVDMFSIPLSLHLTGSQDQTTGTLKDGGRAQIFSDISGNSTFAPLVVKDTRVIAPAHGLDSNQFPSDYFADYIDQVWSTYASQDLKVTTNAGTFTGRVSGDKLSFTGPASVSFDKPSTSDVLLCNGALSAPNDGTTGPVAAALGAAFNRTTLVSNANQPATDASTFYQGDVTNFYAKAMHAATSDGKAYGFAFDDVASFASYIQDSAPTGVTLTLTPFS